MLNLVLIAAVVCFVVDVSGVVDSIKKFVWKTFAKGVGDYHTLSLKPFSCSLCSVWWAGLIYILAVGKFTIPYVAFVALLSLLSSKITDLEIWLMDAFDYIIQLLYKPITKQ